MRKPRHILVFVLLLAGSPALAQDAARSAGPGLEQVPVVAQDPRNNLSAQQPPAGQPELSPRQKEEQRADILMARKRYSEAAEVYEMLLKQEPRNALLLNKAGIAYSQQARLGAAKRYYERAMKADPSYASAISNLGSVHYDRKKYRKAIQLYKQAIALRGEVAGFHRNLGYAYFAEKKYEDSMAAFHRAIELDPEVFERRNPFGTVLQHGRVGDKGAFYFFIAKSYAALGNAERCAHYLTKARDENYKGLAAVETDPAFAAVRNDPLVQQALHPNPPIAVAPPPGC